VRIFLGLIVMLALMTACRARSGAASLGEVPVVAPFDSMALPINGGTVWQCNAARIKVVYDGADKTKLGDDYAQAIGRHGWTITQPGAANLHQWIGRFERVGSAERLTLEVHDADFNGKVPNGVEVFISIQ
jgi:hypothetical protein